MVGRIVRWVAVLFLIALVGGIGALAWAQNVDQRVALRLDLGPLVGAAVMDPSLPALGLVAGGVGAGFLLGFVAGIAVWSRSRGSAHEEDAFGG